MNRDKILKVLDFFRILDIGRFGFNQLFPKHIRVFNYHHVPPSEFEQFKAQIKLLCRKMQPAHPSDITNLLENGTYKYSRPSFVLTFDDGLESQATYVSEYLTSVGISAMFFVPTNAPDTEPEDQLDWARNHAVLKQNESAYVDGRIFASWDRWKVVKRNHVVASHTKDHVRFQSHIDRNTACQQVIDSFKKLQSELDISNRIFCWVGGEFTSYSKAAVLALHDADATECYTTSSFPVLPNSDKRRIERTNLESSFDLLRVKLALSGIVDMRYFLKRRRLSRYYS